MNKEKRSYIRIYDRILLRYQRLSPEEFEQRVQEYQEGKDQPWIDPIRPPGEVRKLESLLKKLRERDRDLAGIMELLHQKIDRILIHLLGPECLKGFREVEANLSAGGIRVPLKEEVKEGEIFELDLGLLPEWSFMRTYGEVVRVEEGRTGEKEVAFRFIWITEGDQDRLVQHIFRQQVLQLQASRRIKRLKTN